MLKLPRFLAVALACLPLWLGTAQAKMSNWTDAQGATFKAEPSGIYGPFAVFRTPAGGGRRVLCRNLSPEDCRRFQAEVGVKSVRAAKWSKTASSASYDFVGRLHRIEGEKVVPVDFAAIPEPDFYILFLGSAWGGESYETTHLYATAHARLKRLYGDRFETVFLGLRHDKSGNDNIARATQMPWLIADFESQSSMECFQHFAPAEGQRFVLITREGVPLVMSEVASIQALKQFIDEAGGFIATTDPLNPLGWPDRLHFLNATRPVTFAKSAAPAELINPPLRADGLRRLGIARLAATLTVAEDGKVTAAKLKPEGSLSAERVAQLEKALVTNSLVTPAIQQGQPIASTLDYAYQVPPADPNLELERTWLFLSAHKELPLSAWLVLRPIAVGPKLFSTIESTDAAGVNHLTAITVSADPHAYKHQINAFRTDFFPEGGAGEVRPAEGQIQEVNGNELAWERLAAADGFVDFNPKAEKMDYCVGYAWAELDAPAAGPAFLGLGSDDGVKVWLNGKLVCDRWIARSSKIDEDLIPIPLVAGKNQILVKIQNISGGWSFLARVRR